MKNTSILPICLLLIFSLQAHCQVADKKDGATLKESVDEVKASIKGIGNLFKKKEQQESPNQIDESKGNSTENGIPVSTGSVTHIQGGKISANVVHIDADRFSNFNDGVAIVHKGNASAMINSKGEMVFPYNTHDFFAIANTYRFHGHEVSHLGIFPYDLKRHYMNSKGVELKGKWSDMDLNSGMLGYAQELYDRPKTAQGRYQFQQVYMDRNANTYVFMNMSLSNINEGIGAYSKNVNGQWQYGYYRITGEKITDPLYHEANAFSDGMAVVGKKDEFGNMKYGYINVRGELQIPFIFSNRPHPFSFGFAKVVPKNKVDFDYAFIDKQGKVVFSQSGMDKRKQGNFEFQPFQNYGLTTTTGNFYVLDSLFKIQTKDEFFAGFGLQGITHFHYPDYYADNKIGKPGLISVVGETDPKIYFSNNDMNHDGILRGKELRVGFINLKSKTVILPAFSKIGVFDPISGLAYAEVSTVVKASNGFSNVMKTTKGYINELGEWVILQEKGGTW